MLLVEGSTQIYNTDTVPKVCPKCMHMNNKIGSIIISNIYSDLIMDSQTPTAMLQALQEL